MSNSKNSTEDSGPTEPTLVGEDDNAALIWRRKHPPLKISGSPSSNNEAGTSSWPLPEPPKVQFIATRKTFDNVASVRPNNVVIMAIFGYDPERFQGLLEHVLGASLADESYVPLIVTDQLNHGSVRRAGLNLEYFPADVYCQPDQTDVFAERMHQVWRKWGAVSLIDLSKPGFLKARLEDYERLLLMDRRLDQYYNPRRVLPESAPPAITDIAALKADYFSKELDKQPDTFVLYRTLGNDLPPRHQAGQTLENLKFILENEAEFPNCEKRWIVNRVIDKDAERSILDLLDAHEQPYLHFPFEIEAYNLADWHLDGFPELGLLRGAEYDNMQRHDQIRAEVHLRSNKIGYITNNNGARNEALREGRQLAKWVLPWDGNCFLTKSAWDEIANTITSHPYMKYFCVPMARASDNEILLTSKADTLAATGEPQIVFRSDATEEFDEERPYGRRPKVELLWRLGVPGIWDSWTDDVWDLPRPERCADAGSFMYAGSVVRLQSGNAEMENESTGGLAARGRARQDALIDVVDNLDKVALGRSLDRYRLTVYDAETIDTLRKAPDDTGTGRVYNRLLQEADVAVQRGSYSVTDKKLVPPSGDKHDYFSPSAFWWPQEGSESGLPGRWRDGRSAPETRLFSPESDSFDRTRLQRLIYDVTVLALAGRASDNKKYCGHATGLLRRWFVNSETRMNPSLEFAYYRPNSEKHGESALGILEMHDVHYLFDAIRLLAKSGSLNDVDRREISLWMQEYLSWLTESPQGKLANEAKDYLGTCYDLQVASIACFLGDLKTLSETLLTSRVRLMGQIEEAGRLQFEADKDQSDHFSALCLQSWVYLANLAEKCGDNLWGFSAKEFPGLEGAFEWFLHSYQSGKWPHPQDGEFDVDRFLPLISTSISRFGEVEGVVAAMNCFRKPVFFASDGVVPFWMLNNGLRGVWGNPSDKMKNLLRRNTANLRRFSREGTRKVRNLQQLETMLWGGYPNEAQDELQSVLASADSSAKDKELAAWMLARWHFYQADAQKSLEYLQNIPPIIRSGKIDYVLLETQCLRRTGRSREAKALLEQALGNWPSDPSLYFSMANTFMDNESEASAETDDKRLELINRVYLGIGLSPLEKLNPSAPLDFFNFRAVPVQGSDATTQDQPKISVIIPVYNGAETIRITLRSLLEQSWSNLQIIVVDDASDDATCEIVREIAATDPRVELTENPTNSGAYVARNAGLEKADGYFITVHDADDWSHPQKLELQARELVRLGEGYATVTSWGRMSSNLEALGNWRPAASLFSLNHSSLMMFRKDMMKIGPWDPVRIGANTELIERFREMFGANALKKVFSYCPLSLSLVREDALTRNKATHIRTLYYGIRLDYRKAYKRWHKRTQESGKDDLTLAADKRKFPAPTTMLPNRDLEIAYDFVFVSDFSKGAPLIDTAADQIAFALDHDKKVALFHWPDFEGDIESDLDSRICDYLDDMKVDQISAFMSAKADRVVLCDPLLAARKLEGIPEFGANHVLVLCGDASSTDVAHDGRKRKMPTTRRIEEIFSLPCRWVPDFVNYVSD